MTNLLPPEARKELIKEYWLRVMTAWSVLFIGVLIGVGALLVPSYLLIESERDAFEVGVGISAGNIENSAAVESEAQAINVLAAELKKKQGVRSISVLIEAVAASIPSGIRMQSYGAVRAEDGISTIAVTGVATSRSELIAFRDALRSRDEFTEVEVPIEDFVKESDLPFEIIISIADNFK